MSIDHTIIIPAGRLSPYLRHALESAASQDVEPGTFEVIVVADRCPALTPEALQALWPVPGAAPELRFVRTPRPGLSAAVNTALDVARGRYHTILPDDDTIYPAKLRLLGTALDGDATAVAAYSLPQWTDARGRNVATPPRVHQYLRVHPRLCWAHIEAKHGLLVHGTSLLYRADVVRAAGGWDERIETAEEWELNLRLLALGHMFIAVDEVLTTYRQHGDNKSRAHRGRRQATMAYVYAKMAKIRATAV